MHVPAPWYQLHDLIKTYLPHLRPAEHRGLVWWVLGTILAHNACQNAVVNALSPFRRADASRQALREWLYDGQDKAKSCQTQLEVRACFAPLLRWVVRWWQSDRLALAVDATHHRQELVILVVSVLYRGTAIPVAWYVQPGLARRSWVTELTHLLTLLQPAIPPDMLVVVLADRGLWSPRLWRAIQASGAHPLLRLQGRVTFQPDGGRRLPLRCLVPGPGHAWIGSGRPFKDRQVPGYCTALVVWGAAHEDPWLLLTDLAPEAVEPGWYGLRSWIEVGFRTLKSMGWHWERSRRTDPERVARHWLVLAVATLWTVAVGTRAEEADWVDQPAWEVCRPQERPAGYRRQTSVFQRGSAWIKAQFVDGSYWTDSWLADDPWPTIPGTLHITYHDASAYLPL